MKRAAAGVVWDWGFFSYSRKKGNWDRFPFPRSPEVNEMSREKVVNFFIVSGGAVSEPSAVQRLGVMPTSGWDENWNSLTFIISVATDLKGFLWAVFGTSLSHFCAILFLEAIIYRVEYRDCKAVITSKLWMLWASAIYGHNQAWKLVPVEICRVFAENVYLKTAQEIKGCQD